MGPDFVVVRRVSLEDVGQVRLAEHDEVVERFARISTVPTAARPCGICCGASFERLSAIRSRIRDSSPPWLKFVRTECCLARQIPPMPPVGSVLIWRLDSLI